MSDEKREEWSVEKPQDEKQQKMEEEIMGYVFPSEESMEQMAEELPKIEMEITSTKIEAKERKLKAVWTVEASEELNNVVIYDATVKLHWTTRLKRWIANWWMKITGQKHQEEKTSGFIPKEETYDGPEDFPPVKTSLPIPEELSEYTWEKITCLKKYIEPDKVHFLHWGHDLLKLWVGGKFRFSSDGKNWKYLEVYGFEKKNGVILSFKGCPLEVDDIDFIEMGSAPLPEGLSLGEKLVNKQTPVFSKNDRAILLNKPVVEKLSPACEKILQKGSEAAQKYRDSEINPDMIGEANILNEDNSLDWLKEQPLTGNPKIDNLEMIPSEEQDVYIEFEDGTSEEMKQKTLLEIEQKTGNKAYEMKNPTGEIEEITPIDYHNIVEKHPHREMIESCLDMYSQDQEPDWPAPPVGKRPFPKPNKLELPKGTKAFIDETVKKNVSLKFDGNEEFAILLVPASWGNPGDELSYKKKIQEHLFQEQHLMATIDYDLVPVQYYIPGEIWPALEENYPGVKYRVLLENMYMIEIGRKMFFVRIIKFKGKKDGSTPDDKG